MNLQFHIAVNEQDPIANYLADSARANDLITLQGPTGSFILNENSPRALVFIAEGIGFASIKGLIEHAMALDTAERIYLFWSAADEDGAYLNNLCRAWNDALDNFEYRPLTGAAAKQDLGDQLAQELEPHDPAVFDYYLCVSESMRQQFEQFAGREGIPAHQFLFEPILLEG